MSEERRFDLPSIGAAAWRARLIFIEIISTCLLIALIFIHSQEPQYSAVTIIAQQEEGQSNPLNNSSALKALSSLTGTQMGMQSEMDEFLKVLATPDVAARLIKRIPVMQHVFRSEFDQESGQWLVPKGRLFTLKEILYPVIGAPVKRTLNQFDLAAYVSRRVVITKDRATSLVSVSYSDADPKFSVEFLSALFDVADEQMRGAIRVRAANNVKSLGKMISSLDNADLKLSLIGIFQTQEQRYMLASSGDTYAFRYVQAPTTSGRPTWPIAWQILGAAAILGAMLSLILSVFLFVIDRSARPSGLVDRIRKSASFIAALRPTRRQHGHV